MRNRLRRGMGLLALPFVLAPAWAQSPAAKADDDVRIGYPAQVALSDEGAKGFIYRRFPGSQRLYTYDMDSATHSACNEGCYQARPPVVAPSTSKPVGDWSIVTRDDGLNQWAYKGKPVYTFFHDDPGAPSGDGEGGVWHLLPYTQRP